MKDQGLSAERDALTAPTHRQIRERSELTAGDVAALGQLGIHVGPNRAERRAMQRTARRKPHRRRSTR
jgi:hypothetical protein